MLRVVYHTHTYFLDNSIELINELKKHVDLHVFVELTLESSKSTIIDVDRKYLNGKITDLKEVLSKDDWIKLEPYFDGAKSCKAILYRGKHMFSVENIPTVNLLKNEIRALQPQVVHFDTISNRCLWLYNSLKKYKLIATLHDPIPHSGEGSWKQNMSKVFFERVSDAYCFHSNYAELLYKSSNKYPIKKTFQLGMKPYSIIQSYLQKKERGSEYILFFGRISAYKGIDLLLKAIPLVHQQFPDEIFMIVGKSEGMIEEEINRSIGKHISYIDEYVSTEELATIISKAKFVVCPYKDATQSGVLMTSFSLNIPVVATNVGAFPEYIDDDVNGLLALPEVESLTDAISMALTENHYLEWSTNLEKKSTKKDSFEQIHEYYETIK